MRLRYLITLVRFAIVARGSTPRIRSSPVRYLQEGVGTSRSSCVRFARGPSKCGQAHVLLSFNANDYAKDGLYPGQRLKVPYTLRYMINHELYLDLDAKAQSFKVELFSGDMEPKFNTYPIDNDF